MVNTDTTCRQCRGVIPDYESEEYLATVTYNRDLLSIGQILIPLESDDLYEEANWCNQRCFTLWLDGVLNFIIEDSPMASEHEGAK